MSKRFWVVSAAIVLAFALNGCTSQSSAPNTATGTAKSTPLSPTQTTSPIIDHGAETGAEGTVIDDVAGDPVTYVVASGDNLSSIADRLGITVDELTTTSGAYGQLQPGMKLALKP